MKAWNISAVKAMQVTLKLMVYRGTKYDGNENGKREKKKLK